MPVKRNRGIDPWAEVSTWQRVGSGGIVGRFGRANSKNGRVKGSVRGKSPLAAAAVVTSRSVAGSGDAATTEVTFPRGAWERGARVTGIEPNHQLAKELPGVGSGGVFSRADFCGRRRGNASCPSTVPATDAAGSRHADRQAGTSHPHAQDTYPSACGRGVSSSEAVSVDSRATVVRLRVFLGLPIHGPPGLFPGGQHHPRRRPCGGGFTCDGYGNKCTVFGTKGRGQEMGHGAAPTNRAGAQASRPGEASPVRYLVASGASPAAFCQGPVGFAQLLDSSSVRDAVVREGQQGFPFRVGYPLHRCDLLQRHPKARRPISPVATNVIADGSGVASQRTVFTPNCRLSLRQP